MARRRAKSQNESLDLLLDTMCNAFGGIVLIAILVAMLIQEPGEGGGKPGGLNQENIREIEQAFKELSELEREVTKAEADADKMGDLINLIIERDKLAGQLDEKQQAGTMSMIELIEKLKTLLAQKSAAEANAGGLEKEIASLDLQLKELLRQLKELEDQEKALIAANKQELRPPRLQTTQGQQVNFLVRYDEVFATQDLTVDSAGNLTAIENNTRSLTWNGDSPQPIAGKGLKIGTDTEKLKTMLESMKRYNGRTADETQQAYAISIVYGDSFDTVGDFRKLIQQVGGIKDGWEPVEDSFTPSFGAGGAQLGTQ